MSIIKKQKTEPDYSRLLGVHRKGKEYRFAVSILDDEEAFLLLYEGGREPSEEIPLPVQDREGSVAVIGLEGLDADKYQYNYKIKGKIVQDPYAEGLAGLENFGEALDGNPHAIRCTLKKTEKYDWEGDKPLNLPYEELILYKLHVRGFTKQAAVRRKGTFSGLQEMIPYLKDLGVNALELMPAYEFAECPQKQELTGFVISRQDTERVNYWGYTEGFYFSPKRSYCFGKNPAREVRDLVKALHKERMECIMEFFFPYGVNPLLVLDALRYWRKEYHIDGFHLLGDGVPVDLVIKDPLLCTCKLLFTGFDAGAVYGGRVPSRRRLGEYNMGFQQDMRRFLKSDDNMLRSALYRIKRNPATHGVINYMTSQDGFTLHDMVTYNGKHNEDNGFRNRDGIMENHSWNCGIEGLTKRKLVLEIRQRQLKNAFLLMLLSQGTPMLYAGDEIANSQDGNNNAWCQDNPTGWVNWRNLRKNRRLMEFVKSAIAFRREHPVLHAPAELKGVDYKAMGCPDVSIHSEKAWYVDFEDNSHSIGIMYAGSYAGEEGFLYIAYNFDWEESELALPNLAGGMIWRIVADTGLEESFLKIPGKVENQKKISVKPRTIVILQGKAGVKKDASVETL